MPLPDPIAWFVASDAGAAGMTLPDRSALANDAPITVGPLQPTETDVWKVMNSRCPCLEIIPFLTGISGAKAPDLGAYTLTDFTAVVCAAVFGSPTEFYGVLSHSGGEGVNRKWILGFEKPSPDNTSPASRTCLHLSDGASFPMLTGAPWPDKLVETATAIPGGGGTMEGMYAVAVRRVGNTFAFFYKGAAFRATDGACIDPVTGLAATVAPAIAQGTATSAIVPGNVAGPLLIGSGGENNAFGATTRTTWALLYDTGALTDADILGLLDTAYPVCGTLLTADLAAMRRARAACGVLPACAEDEEPGLVALSPTRVRATWVPGHGPLRPRARRR